jgi:hypothetical protein
VFFGLLWKIWWKIWRWIRTRSQSTFLSTCWFCSSSKIT